MIMDNHTSFKKEALSLIWYSISSCKIQVDLYLSSSGKDHSFETVVFVMNSLLYSYFFLTSQLCYFFTIHIIQTHWETFLRQILQDKTKGNHLDTSLPTNADWLKIQLLTLHLKESSFRLYLFG